MKRKWILSALFIISLLPMLLNQYGGRRGIQEITGLINLFNPIGFVSVAFFGIGVWVPFKKKIYGNILGSLGTIGIVASEVYTFFTWHVMTITGKIDLQQSIRLAFPEFYIGLAVSAAMILAYFGVDKKWNRALVMEQAD